ncbi:hypothetical protein, partial [Streptococcus sobrinus]|uniref:hypothetical protein n=1 Tax=Streptococcus sobrinus TaxID=1310 RepID=UPI001C3F8965
TMARIIAKTAVILFDINSPHYYSKEKLIFCKLCLIFFPDCLPLLLESHQPSSQVKKPSSP